MRALLLVLLLPALARAGCSVMRGEAEGKTVLILRNDVLEVRILPESGGILDSLIFRPTGEELLMPLTESRIEFSPLLPATTRRDGGGFQDWFWQTRQGGAGVNAGSLADYQILKSEPGEASVVLRGEMGIFDIVKRYRLRDGEAVLDCETTFINPTTEKASLDYWLHATLNPEVFLDAATGAGLATVPLKKDARMIREKKTEATGRREIVTALLNDNYSFFALAEPWLARVSPRSGTALLVLASRAEADLLASVWQFGGVSSLEMIFPPHKLAPGEQITFSCQWAVAAQAAPLLGVLPGIMVSKDALIAFRPSPAFTWRMSHDRGSVPALEAQQRRKLPLHGFSGEMEITRTDETRRVMVGSSAPPRYFSQP